MADRIERIVTFEISEDKSGSYAVDVGYLSASFNIDPEDRENITSPAKKSIWPAVFVVVISPVMKIIGICFLVKRRNRQTTESE
ncbi:hypothetical protein ACFLXP_02940 [Chloroflexota bacterium]